jgi:hypothetical protein
VSPSAEDALTLAGAQDRHFSLQYIDAAGAVTSSPTWSPTPSYAAPTANCCELVAAAAGGQLRVVANAAQANTRAALLYRPVAGSAIRYSWDKGATWTALDTSSGYVAVLAGLPAAGTWTLDIQDTGSARAAVTGLNLRKTAGLVLHKVAVPGIRSTHFAAQAGTAGFRAHWAELGVDQLTISLGANDRVGSIPEATVAANYDAIAAGVRAGVPWTGEAPVSLLYAPQPDNLLTDNPFPMSVYARAVAQGAVAAGVALLDLDRFVDKAASWYDSDGIHPSPSIAGPAMARALARMLDR